MKVLNKINELNFKAVVASCLVLGVFGIEVSHAGDSTNTANVNSHFQVRNVSFFTKKAKECLDLKKDRAVLLLVSNLLEVNPGQEDIVEALFLQGKAYSNLGRYRKAIDSYSKIIKLSMPGIKKSLAYSYRADLYEKISEFDQALIDKDQLNQNM